MKRILVPLVALALAWTAAGADDGVTWRRVFTDITTTENWQEARRILAQRSIIEWSKVYDPGRQVLASELVPLLDELYRAGSMPLASFYAGPTLTPRQALLTFAAHGLLPPGTPLTTPLSQALWTDILDLSDGDPEDYSPIAGRRLSDILTWRRLPADRGEGWLAVDLGVCSEYRSGQYDVGFTLGPLVQLGREGVGGVTIQMRLHLDRSYTADLLLDRAQLFFTPNDWSLRVGLGPAPAWLRQVSGGQVAGILLSAPNPLLQFHAGAGVDFANGSVGTVFSTPRGAFGGIGVERRSPTSRVTLLVGLFLQSEDDQGTIRAGVLPALEVSSKFGPAFFDLTLAAQAGFRENDGDESPLATAMASLAVGVHVGNVLRVVVPLVYAAGEDDSTTHTLYRGTGWYPVGSMLGDAPLGNTIVLGAEVEITPIGAVTVTTAYHHFLKVSLAGVVPGLDPDGSAGRDLGGMAEVDVIYAPFQDLRFRAWGGMRVPGLEFEVGVSAELLL